MKRKFTTEHKKDAELKSLRFTVNALQAAIDETCGNARDLVSYGRTQEGDPPCRLQRDKELEKKFPQQTSDLNGPSGDYHHGFNNACLAFRNLFYTILKAEEDVKEVKYTDPNCDYTVEDVLKNALQNFPETDT